MAHEHAKNKVFIVYMNGTVARAKGNTPSNRDAKS